MVIGCYPRDETLAQAVPVWLVPAAADLRLATQFEDTGGTRHTLQPGDVVYVESTDEVFRMQAGDEVTRLIAQPGVSLPVQNRGVWNAANQRLEGVTVAATGRARWKLEAPAPVVSGVALSKPTFGQEWQLTSNLKIATSWQNDTAGPYLRIKSEADDVGVLLQTLLQEGLSGRPLTLCVEVRASRPGVDFWLTAYDNSPGAEQRSVSRKETLTDTWRTLTFYVPPLTSPTEIDKLGGGPTGLKDGEYVDIRLMAVYDGLVP
jgi:hypothetical protein